MKKRLRARQDITSNLNRPRSNGCEAKNPLIDDDPATLLALPEALRSRFSDVAIDVVSSAESALPLIQRIGYDLIICDIIMPGMDGIGLLQEARRLRPELVIVMVTAGDLGREEEAMAHGAFAFVAKPFDIDTFESTIATGLQMEPGSRS